MKKASRRDFIAASLLGAGAASLGLLALSKYAEGRSIPDITEAMGPLRPVADDNTGLPLLLLPEGFRYRSFSWAGTPLHDGHAVPRLADGMGVVRNDGSRIIGKAGAKNAAYLAAQILAVSDAELGQKLRDEREANAAAIAAKDAALQESLQG